MIIPLRRSIDTMTAPTERDRDERVSLAGPDPAEVLRALLKVRTEAGSVAEKPRYVGRERARTVRCPRCDAAPGDYCEGRNGPRISNHPERVTARLAQDEGPTR